METLQIMPVQNQSRFNLGEYAEEATLVEEIAAPKRVNHFIEYRGSDFEPLTKRVHYSSLF